ncbi:MAG: DUF6580 family putative transport protein [Lacipirellulaceae bacterium]
MNRDTLRDLIVFTLLLTIGVVGRWAQPAWNFTPLAAVAMMGGYYFRSLLPALLLPLGVLAVSDLTLLAHNSLAVQLSVYLAVCVPWMFGRSLRNKENYRTLFALGGGVASSLAFFVVTNLAVWAAHNYYPHTWAGLVECYVAAVPFFRTMLAGDIFYVSILFGGLSLAEQLSARRVEAK